MNIIRVIFFLDWPCLIFVSHVKGMAQFVGNFAEKGDPEYQPPVQKGETPVCGPLLEE